MYIIIIIYYIYICLFLVYALTIWLYLFFFWQLLVRFIPHLFVIYLKEKVQLDDDGIRYFSYYNKKH